MAESLGLKMWKYNARRFRIHGNKGVLSKHIQETEEETSGTRTGFSVSKVEESKKGQQTTEFEVNCTLTKCSCGRDSNVFENGRTECIDCYLKRKTRL